MVSEIERIDLVLIEFNVSKSIYLGISYSQIDGVQHGLQRCWIQVNDSFISDLPHALEDKGEDGRTRGEYT